VFARLDAKEVLVSRQLQCSQSQNPTGEIGVQMGRVSIVAERLKEARLRAGISQKQLGIRAGIDPFSASARVNQYERDKHMPDLQTLAHLAKVLGVPVPYFYCADPELAALVVKFSALGKAQRKRLLGLADDL
jgi:transcriptional regulator with XRE-family HTH domain